MLPNASGTSSKEARDKYVATLAQRWQDCTGNSYYTVNRILLLCVGLWPYQKSSHRRALIAITTVTLSCGTIVQLLTFVTTKFTVDLLLHVLAYSIPNVMYMVKYNIICIKAKKMRDIMERVRCDWNELNNTQEIEIIKKYSNIGRYFTLSCVWFLYPAACCFLIIQFVPNILDMATTSANQSRPRVLPIMIEIFLDQQKYYFVILFGVCVVLMLGNTTLLATETFLASCIHHAGGLFEIANFRIEQAFQKQRRRFQNIGFSAKRNTVDEIISAVVMYRKALEFVIVIGILDKFINLAQVFTLSYTAIVPIGVLSVSVNIYHFCFLLMTGKHYEMGVSFFSVLAHWCYMFFFNYLGQKVIDQSSEIFRRSYSARWYTSSQRAQKLMSFVMQRGTRHCALQLGGMFVLSLEGFAKLSSTSISYFMMFRSVQDW